MFVFLQMSACMCIEKKKGKIRPVFSSEHDHPSVVSNRMQLVDHSD